MTNVNIYNKQPFWLNKKDNAVVHLDEFANTHTHIFEIRHGISPQFEHAECMPTAYLFGAES